MRIPSYDDLTPSIPDITPRETFSQVKRFLPRAGTRRRRIRRQTRLAASASFAVVLRVCSLVFRSKTPPPHFAIARDFSPRIERHGASSVVLDVGGLGRLLGDAQAIGAELDRAAAGSAASLRIAIARTQTAARLLAIGCPGLTVAPGEVAAAIAPLPIEALRAFMDDEDEEIRGGNAATRMKATVGRLDTFRRWGLTTLGDIAALPAADLSERMGQAGLALQQLARGVDRAPLVPDPGVPRFVQSMELEWPIDSLEPLSFVLARLLDPLSSALERADRGAAALRLDLRLVDRTIARARAAAAGRDARREGAAHAAAPRSRIASTVRRHRHRHHRNRSGARAHRSVLAARARDAVAGNAGHADRPPRRARRRSRDADRPRSSTRWRPDGFEMQRVSPDSARPLGTAHARAGEPRCANREREPRVL